MVWEDNLFTVWILSVGSYLEYILVGHITIYSLRLSCKWLNLHFKSSYQNS